jgi:hypothetical protein
VKNGVNLRAAHYCEITRDWLFSKKKFSTSRFFWLSRKSGDCDMYNNKKHHECGKKFSHPRDSFLVQMKSLTTDSSTKYRKQSSYHKTRSPLLHLLGLRGGFVKWRLKVRSSMLPGFVNSGSHIVS